MAFLWVGLPRRSQHWVRLCWVVRKAPEETALWAVGSPVPWLLLQPFPGVTAQSCGPSSVLGVPSARDPTAPAACSGCCLVLLHCSLRRGVCPPCPSAFYAHSPVTNLQALGPARVSINVWLTWSCVLFWGLLLGWRGTAQLSAEWDRLYLCCSQPVHLLLVVEVTG